jgi:hypothetical protein
MVADATEGTMRVVTRTPERICADAGPLLERLWFELGASADARLPKDDAAIVAEGATLARTLEVIGRQQSARDRLDDMERRALQSGWSEEEAAEAIGALRIDASRRDEELSAALEDEDTLEELLQLTALIRAFQHDDRRREAS